MREYVWLECTVCGSRNYRTNKETRGAERLTLNKFCRKEGLGFLFIPGIACDQPSPPRGLIEMMMDAFEN